MAGNRREQRRTQFEDDGAGEALAKQPKRASK